MLRVWSEEGRDFPCDLLLAHGTAMKPTCTCSTRLGSAEVQRFQIIVFLMIFIATGDACPTSWSRNSITLVVIMFTLENQECGCPTKAIEPPLKECSVVSILVKGF